MKKVALMTASTLALCGCFGEDDKQDGNAANSYVAQLISSDFSDRKSVV